MYHVILLRFGFIFMVIAQSHGSVSLHKFSQLEERDSINGELFQTAVTRSSVHCSVRCVFDSMCFAYQYTNQNNFNCVIVHRKSVARQNLPTNGTNIYLKVCRESWTPPNNWTAEDKPAVYRSFNEENYCLQPINGASIASGKVLNAMKTNSSFQQWVSLGDISLFTCLPVPDTCGPEGASLSVWLKIDECQSKAAIISSMAHPSNGFSFHCESGKIRYAVRVSDGYFHKNAVPPSDWYHLAMIFHGPNDGQGISIYHDGNLVKHDSTKAQKNYTQSSGTVIIGKRYTDRDEDYGSVMVDELTFWDRQLLPAEIQAMAAM